MTNSVVYDVVIAGAGIVGLSTGYNLLLKRPEVKIAYVEKEDDVACHQTGRNSGVIHSGIYYKPGSSKAINCKKGYELLIDFCRQEGIDYEICGKLIVATQQNEEHDLQQIYKRGLANGLEGLRIIDPNEIRNIEPHVKGTKAIWVPQAGIVDYGKVAQRLKEKLQSKGVHFYFSSKIRKIERGQEVYQLHCEDKIVASRYFINCTGLYADKIARMNGLKINARIIPFRGEYYLLKPEKAFLVNNLVYPVPNPNFPFLGVHFTRRINGDRDAGPNAVLAFSREGYTKSDIKIPELLNSLTYIGFLKLAWQYWRVGFGEMHRSFSKNAFTKALKRLIPEIDEKDLIPGKAGVRAQLCYKDGKLVDDFMIEYGEKSVHVLNAPSPAATASLQIGKTVCEKLEHIL